MLSYKVPVLHRKQYSAIWRELKLFKMYISKPVTITKNVLKVKITCKERIYNGNVQNMQFKSRKAGKKNRKYRGEMQRIEDK